eukprot:Hpha_TRINITY_DN23791_c0_g1::TRINITY_DN23791_c0_g1_i1::g.93200::m.93200
MSDVNNTPVDEKVKTWKSGATPRPTSTPGRSPRHRWKAVGDGIGVFENVRFLDPGVDETTRLLCGDWQGADGFELVVCNAAWDNGKGMLVRWMDRTMESYCEGVLRTTVEKGFFGGGRDDKPEWMVAQQNSMKCWLLAIEGMEGQLYSMHTNGKGRVTGGWVYKCFGEDDLQVVHEDEGQDQGARKKRTAEHFMKAAGFNRLQSWYRKPLGDLARSSMRVLLGTWEQRHFSRGLRKRGEYKVRHRGCLDFWANTEGTVLRCSVLLQALFLLVWTSIMYVIFMLTHDNGATLETGHTQGAVFIGLLLVMFNTQAYERHQYALQALVNTHACIRKIVTTVTAIGPGSAHGGKARKSELEVLRFIPALLASVRHTLCTKVTDRDDDEARHLTSYIVDEVARFLTAEELLWVVGKGPLPKPPLKVEPKYWARCRTYGPGWTAWDLSTGRWVGPPGLCPVKDASEEYWAKCRSWGADFEDKSEPDTPTHSREVEHFKALPAPPNPPGVSITPSQKDEIAVPWVSLSRVTRGLFWVAAPRCPNDLRTDFARRGDGAVSDRMTERMTTGMTELQSELAPAMNVLSGVDAHATEVAKTPVRIQFLLQRASINCTGGFLNEALDEMQQAIQQMHCVGDTQLPLPWVHLVPTLIYVWLLTIPFDLFSVSRNQEWVAILVTPLLGILLLGLYQVATDLADPFGFDLNDIDVVRFEGDMMQMLMTTYPDLSVEELHASQREGGKGRIWDDRWLSTKDQQSAGVCPAGQSAPRGSVARSLSQSPGLTPRRGE